MPLLIVGLALRRRDGRDFAFTGLAMAYINVSGVWRLAWLFAMAPEEFLLSSLLVAYLTPTRSKCFYAILGFPSAMFEFFTGLLPTAGFTIIGVVLINCWSVTLTAKVFGIFAVSALLILLGKAMLFALFVSPDINDVSTR